MAAHGAQAIACSLTAPFGCVQTILADPGAVATLLGSIFTGFVTAAGFYFVWSQISMAERQNAEERQWKRSEFVRALLSEMVSNPNIALVARILDWREGPARIPEPFQRLFDEIRSANPRAWDTHRIADNYFEINWERFIRALAVYRDPEWREADMYMYRTCFDSFCTFIQGVAEDVRALDVAASEYADLSYYCHRIIFPRDAARNRAYEADVKLYEYIAEYYSDRTYNVMLRQAEVYASTHPEQKKKRDRFPERNGDRPIEATPAWLAQRERRAKSHATLRRKRETEIAAAGSRDDAPIALRA